MLRAFLVDRKLQKNYSRAEKMRRVKENGDGKPVYRKQRGSSSSNKRRVLWDVSIVCNKTGCHARKHCKTGEPMYQSFAKTYLAGAQCDDGDDYDPAPE